MISSSSSSLIDKIHIPTRTRLKKRIFEMEVSPEVAKESPTSKSSKKFSQRNDGVPPIRSVLIKRRYSVAAPLLSDDESLEIQQQQLEKEKGVSPGKRQLYVVSSLIAGFGSGALASIVCAPMDLIRTRMQVMGALKLPPPPTVAAAAEAATKMAAAAVVQNRMSAYSHISTHLRQIIQTEGPLGYFRGLGATLATVPTFWSMYFPLYDEMKTFFAKLYAFQHHESVEENIGDRTHPLVHVSSAIVAGAAADVVCNPMFVVRTRMQTESLHFLESKASKSLGEFAAAATTRHRPMGIQETIASIYTEGGVPAFWRGLTASLIGLSHVAIQFPVYEFLKAEARARNPDGKERPIDILLASGLSKVCGSLVSYPHEVLRSRMMDARGVDAGKSVFQLIEHVVKTEGYGGLYRGLSVSLIRVVPNCCVTFMTYELFIRWTRDNLSGLYLNDTSQGS